MVLAGLEVLIGGGHGLGLLPLGGTLGVAARAGHLRRALAFLAVLALLGGLLLLQGLLLLLGEILFACECGGQRLFVHDLAGLVLLLLFLLLLLQLRTARLRFLGLLCCQFLLELQTLRLLGLFFLLARSLSLRLACGFLLKFLGAFLGLLGAFLLWLERPIVCSQTSPQRLER